MGRFTFKGGIHPYDGKGLSKDKPIKTIFSEGDCVYPLSQHIGAPAKPVVKKGDEVVIGQLIAEGAGFVSANIHAAVSGKVKAIEPRLTVSGDLVPSIVIENDGLFTEMEWPERKPLEELTSSEILGIIQEAGIAGMGGAGFPTHVKMSPKEPAKIEYIIANCAECEPYLTSDYRRMMEEPEKIVGGLRAALKMFPNAKGVLAVEDNKKDAIGILTEAAKDDENISVVKLKTKYPQGAERQLIYAVTKRKINSSMLPADAGCIVNNCDTIYAIYQAVYAGRPLLHRIVTVTGDAIAQPQNFRVPIGTNYHELIKHAGGFVGEPEKIISGGPMMGMGLFQLDVPVTKTSSALLCMQKDDVAESKETACINCGQCVSACPGRVLPSRLADLAIRLDEEGFVKLNGMECCECGCCSYVCPAKRPLTQNIKTMRRRILANRKKK